MKNNSFSKTLNNGSAKAGLAFCALILAAACGKNGGTDAGDPNKSVAANGNEVGNANNGNNAGNANNAGNTSADVATFTSGTKTEALKFAAFYANAANANPFGITVTDYDYCKFATAHNNGAYPSNVTFANLGINLPGTGTLKPGTFTVGKDVMNAPGGIGFTGLVNNCSFDWSTVKGTVTIDAATDTTASGSVDLQVVGSDGTPGTIKGKFSTTPCTGGGGTIPDKSKDPGVCQ